jgi:hypothetical protein
MKCTISHFRTSVAGLLDQPSRVWSATHIAKGT